MGSLKGFLVAGNRPQSQAKGAVKGIILEGEPTSPTLFLLLVLGKAILQFVITSRSSLPRFVSRRGDILYQQGRPTLWIDWRKIALVSCIEGSISPAYILTIYGRSIARGDFLFSRLSQAVNKESGNPCDRIQKCQLFHL